MTTNARRVGYGRGRRHGRDGTRDPALPAPWPPGEGPWSPHQPADFVRPGGLPGIAVPGLRAEIDRVPEHLRPSRQWKFMFLRSVGWWRRYRELTGKVRVLDDWEQEDGRRHWRNRCEVCAEDGAIRAASRDEARMLAADAGRTSTFALVVAQITEPGRT